jgi:hypothetical protein
MSVGMQPPADALVLFGATGDLAKRKLFPALYHLERHGTLNVPVIGVARSDWTDQAFCENAHDSIIAAIPDAKAAVIDALMARLDLIQGDYSDPKTWTTLHRTLDARRLLPVALAGLGQTFSAEGVAMILFGDTGQGQGTVICWGNNSFGQLGVPRPGDRCGGSSLECSLAPIAVFGRQRFKTVSTGFGTHTCGIAVNTSILCWGLGSEGQLGDGYTRDRQSLPVGVLAPSP